MNLKRITNSYNELSVLEKKIVEYLSNHPEDVINMTSRELADTLYISKTTVINLAKKLGFDGYTELKYYLKNQIHHQDDPKESQEDMLFKNIINDISEEATKTLSIQNEDNVRHIVKILMESKTVYVISRGASKPFGSYLSSRLAMLKIRCILVDDLNLIDILSEHIEPDESILLISLSGNTKSIVDISKAAHIKGSKVMVLTSFSDTKVQKNSDVTLYCYAKNTETKHNDLISRIGIHILIQVILQYMQYFVEEGRNDKHDLIRE